jgi:hypothetical protein
MKTTLLFIPIIVLLLSFDSYGQQDLAWCSNTYTGGSLSQTYTGIGSPATNVTIAQTGNTGQFSSGFPQKVGSATSCTSGGYGNPDRERLSIKANYTTNSQCVTTTITFANPVLNLAFNIYEIDGDSDAMPPISYRDQVTVTANLGAGSVAPTLTDNSNFASVSGNVITGDLAQDMASTGPVSVSFAGLYVSSVTLTYCNATGTQADPVSQAYHIGGLTWDGPLPVVLTSFQAQLSQTGITINWQTAAETNSERFDVQRSTDLVSYEAIGSLSAAKTSESTQVYEITDKTPIEGFNYYRLKMIDLDGTFAYSNPIAVLYQKNDTYFNLVSTSGNELRLQTNANEPVFEVFDLLGRSIVLKNTYLGNNLYLLEIATNAQQPALYAVKMQSENRIFIKKVAVY